MRAHRVPVCLLLLASLLVPLARAACAASLRDFRRLQHLVVIYLENRSFDHLFGEFRGADGLPGPDRYVPQTDTSGRVYDVLPVAPGSRLPPDLPNRPFCLDAYYPPGERMPDLSHAYDDEAGEIHGGRMDRYAALNTQRATALGYHHTRDLPLLKWAREYTLCDHFFHGVIGGSMLNHIWLVAAAAPRFEGAPQSVRLQHDAAGRPTHGGFVTEDEFAVNTCQPFAPPFVKGTPDSVRVPPLDMPTIGDRLSEAGLPWAWYAGGWNQAVAGQPDSTFQHHHQPFVFFRKYAEGTQARAEHLKDEEDFVVDLATGRLPAVAFVKPLGLYNEHPGYSDVLTAERHAVDLLELIRKSPQWDSTAVVITYDENGGFWDHVPPPQVDRWGLGVRVPTLVIAPFAKRHHVEHGTLETTSILATIERRWGLAPLTARDAKAEDLSSTLELR